jgi:ribosomal protein L11 methylase PrmA
MFVAKIFYSLFLSHFFLVVQVIVNVGCGTEILSIYCAKAGARNV